MVEVVGAVAGVVQFLDVALRLSSCLERFCSDVRNVPRRFHLLQTDMRKQIEIAHHIQNHHLPRFATAASSTTIDTPLLEYISLAEQLCKTLEGLLARKSDGVLQRGWDAICSVRKKEEVTNICDRLEHKKSTLSLWSNTANLKLTSSLAVTADQTLLDVGEIKTVIKTVESTSNKLATTTAQLVPCVERIDRNLATTSDRTERTRQDTQILLARYDADTKARESGLQIQGMTLAKVEQLLAAFETSTLGSGRHDPRLGGGYIEEHLDVDSSVNDQVQRSTVNCRRRPQKCKCRTVGTARRWQPLSILRFTHIFRMQHFSWCPEYQKSERSLEITMQIVPPSWLLRRTIDIGTHLRNWSTMGNFSMSPMVIGTSRLVDSKTSPAFLAMRNTADELWVLRYGRDQRRLGALTSKLQSALQRLFENEEASVLDTDIDGRTLLNEVIDLCVVSVWKGQEAKSFTALVQHLLSNEAAPNILRDVKPSVIYNSLENFNSGTTCDQLMDSICNFTSRTTGEAQELRTILELLVKAGGHTSKPFVGNRDPGSRCIEFRNEVMQLNIFEDQIDLMDLGDIVPIILQQQEEQLRRTIKNAKTSILNRKSPVNGLAPIHFAVLWPVGLGMLVERGVDMNIEDNCGRRAIHLAVALGLADSVRCLLDADCGLFTPAEDYSLLQYALALPTEQDQSQILLQLVHALVDRHARIMDLAHSRLPPSVFAKLNLTLGELQERRAPSIIEMLLSNGIDVPPALELDGKGLYNMFVDLDGDVLLMLEAANALWSAGFHNIDEPDEDGWTPFLQNWFNRDFEMVKWFAERGVRLYSKHADISLTALHLYAKGLSYDLGKRELGQRVSTSRTKEHYLDAIQKELGIPYDDCTCACSPSGCTPAKFLLVLQDWRDFSHKDKIRTWIHDLNPPRSLSKSYIYHLTRTTLFDFLGGEHTCCSVGMNYSWRRFIPQRPTRTKSWRYGICDFDSSHWPNPFAEHGQCCRNGLPVPRVESLKNLRDPDVFSATFDAAMSHYDEMNRPDTMQAEEQVFGYINWLLEEGYVDLDVSIGCEHDQKDIECFM